MRSTLAVCLHSILTPAWICRFSPGACHNLAHVSEASDLPHHKNMNLYSPALRPGTSYLRQQHRHIQPPSGDFQSPLRF